MSEVRRLVWTMESAGTQKVQDAITKINTSVSTMSESLKEAGKKVTDLGKGLTTKLTLPLVGVGTAATKVTMGFDDTMSQVRAISGATAEQFEALREQAKELGAITAHTASDAGDAQRILASSGMDFNQILETTPQLLTLMSAGSVSADIAARALTGTMAQYNMVATESERITDVLAAGSAASNTEVGLLTETFKMAGGQLASMNMDIEQSAAMAGIMANANLVGSEAGTVLSAMTRDIKANSKELQNMGADVYDTDGKMRDMGSIMKDLTGFLDGMTDAQRDNALSSVFTANSYKGAIAFISQGAENYNKLETEMYKAQGTALSFAEIMEDNIGGAFRELQSAGEGFLIEVGDVLKEPLKNLAEVASEFLNKFKELSKEEKETIVKIGAVVAAIGPLLLILGKVMSLIGSAPAMISNLGTVFGALTSPIGLIIIAVGAFIGVIIHLLQTNEEFRDKMVAAWGAVQNIIQFVGNEMWAIKEVIGLVVEFFVERVQRIAEIFANVVGLISALISGDWAGVWEHAKGIVSGVLGFMLELPKKVFEIGKSIVVNFAEGIKGLGEGLWDKVTGGTPDIEPPAPDGSHRTGLPRVPYDGYIAELHRGEEVLTASDPRNRKNAGEGVGGVRYNPTYNIAINGDASSQDERKLQRIIERVIEKDRDIFYKKLALSRGVV